LLNNFTNNSIDATSPFNVLQAMATRMKGPAPAYVRHILSDLPMKKIEAERYLNSAINKEEFYTKFTSTFQEEMNAVIVYFAGSKHPPEENQLREESYILILRWVRLYETIKNDDKLMQIYHTAEMWYKQYRKVLELAGIKAQDRLVIVDPSMEERIIKKLIPILEKTIRKQNG